MRICSSCGENLSLDNFYFVSRKLGTYRGKCKNCMRETKAAQRDPNWMPTCNKCGRDRPRVGMGRRLCDECFNEIYDKEFKRKNGAHHLKLKPCKSCGSPRLRADHTNGAALCSVCRSVPQHRRNRLKNLFNMNPKEWLALLAYQKEVCPICKKRPRKERFNLDHQHKSPRIVRGATCNRCNTLLGLARDDPSVLKAAAEYLLRPPAQDLFPGREAFEEANRKREPFRRLVRK